MASSVKAYPLYPPGIVGAGAVSPPMGGMFPEAGPTWIWGQGTPAAIDPFTIVQKGSIYSEVNASDDDPCLWEKIDEGGDAADWVRLSNTGVATVKSALYDISANDSEQVVFHAVSACQILEAGLIYYEATVTSDSDEGDFTMGTTTGGNEIVAATNYGLSQATGAYQALTLKAAGAALAAGASVFASHDDAASAAGTVVLQMKVRLEV